MVIFYCFNVLNKCKHPTISVPERAIIPYSPILVEHLWWLLLSNEQLILKAAVNWDGTEKVIDDGAANFSL